jgi:hypothetical protein
MLMHADGDVVLVPDVEHGAVYDVGEGALGVVGNGFSEDIWIVTSAHEPSFTPCERN